MYRFRVLGALAAVLLLAALLVPVLMDRLGPDGQPASPVGSPTPRQLSTIEPSPSPSMPEPSRSVVSMPTTSAPPAGPRSPATLGTITIPRADPPPLPRRDVPPAVLAYSVNCEDGTTTCTSWRLLDWSGRHWSLPAGTGVSIAPNGRRIAYFRMDGRLVYRDLASGAEDVPIQVPAQVVRMRPEMTWSANGRWLAVDYDIQAAGADSRPIALVDTTTMRTQLLPLPCCVAGVHPVEGWVLVDDRSRALPGVPWRAWLDSDGKVLRTLEAPEELADLDWSLGRTRHPLSPDGSRFAISLWDKYGTGDTQLGVISTESGELEARHATSGNLHELLGWFDRATVLARHDDMSVSATNVDTWKATTIYTFPVAPDLLEVATGLARAQ